MHISMLGCTVYILKENMFIYYLLCKNITDEMQFKIFKY